MLYIGKQLAAVRSDGSVTQFKPDLKEAKTYPGPPQLSLRPVSIFWASTYEFFVGYQACIFPSPSVESFNI
jgi:hypothetical protein